MPEKRVGKVFQNSTGARLETPCKYSCSDQHCSIPKFKYHILSSGQVGLPQNVLPARTGACAVDVATALAPRAARCAAPKENDNMGGNETSERVEDLWTTCINTIQKLDTDHTESLALQKVTDSADAGKKFHSNAGGAMPLRPDQSSLF